MGGHEKVAAPATPIKCQFAEQQVRQPAAQRSDSHSHRQTGINRRQRHRELLATAGALHSDSYNSSSDSYHQSQQGQPAGGAQSN